MDASQQLTIRSTAVQGSLWLVICLGVSGAALAALLACGSTTTTALLLLFLLTAVVIYYRNRPYDLLLVMVFLIPFNFVSRIGNVVIAAELLKVFAWFPFLLWLRGSRKEFVGSRNDLWFGILALLAVTSLPGATQFGYVLKLVVRLISNIGLCYLVLNLVDSRQKVFQVFRVLTVSGLVVALYGFYQYAIQDFGALFWIVNPQIETSLAPVREISLEWRNRITSVLNSEMELGHYFNLCLPIAVALWASEGRSRFSSKWFWCFVAMLIGLLLTFTYGSWLALVGTVVIFAWLAGQGHRKRLLLAGVIVAGLAVLALNFAPVRESMESKMEGVAWDYYTRFDMWELALTSFLSHPVRGIGFGNFAGTVVSGQFAWMRQDMQDIGTTPHNFYLYVLAEMGLVGFIAFLVVIGRSILGAFRLKDYGPLGQPGLAVAFAITTVLLAGAVDDSSVFGSHASYLLWFFIGLSEAMSRIKKARFQMSPPGPA
jgi:O-antigen ligase